MSSNVILEGLWNFYQIEYWHKCKLPKEEADKYHQKLLDSGNIITVTDNDTLCGYVEYWRLTYESFGRIICGEPFSAMQEDVQTGWIAYVANTFILPDYRRGKVSRILRDRFIEVNKSCRYFVGEARRHKAGLIKVFKKEDIMSLNKESIHG